MKSKLFARILCIVLCLTIIGSILIIAIPMLTGKAAVVPVSGGSGHITEDYVNLRSGAGTEYAVVTTMVKNTRVTFVDGKLYNGDWYKIREHSTDKTGYVYRSYVAADSSIRISGSAYTYVGCQYAFSFSGAVKPSWASSNTSVATVDQNGVVTAKSVGVTTITASENGGSAACTFTVKKGSSTGISSTSLTLGWGRTAKLTAKTAGVKWYSSNTAVASVSGGTVTAKTNGYATISAYTSSGASTCLVHVVDPPQSSIITLSSTKASTYVDCQYALTQTGAANPVWASSDPTVASVDKNGIVTAKSAGSAIVTVTDGAEMSYCRFTVKEGTPTGISESSLLIIKDSTALLSSNTSGVKWYSSNKNVAAVSNGVVTAKGAGYATVSAYTSSGASTCLVQVTSSAVRSNVALCTYQASTYVGCQYAFWQTGAASPVWASSDPNVASIDGNGVVTAKAAGVTTLSASQNGEISTAKFIVTQGVGTGISKSSLELPVGNTESLTAKASGVKWYSSNKNVATVSGGAVTAKAEGYATVSAYTSGGASTCLVHVVPKEEVTATGCVTGGSVNVRSGAGTDNPVIAVLSQNDRFSFLGETLYNGNWYHIRLENGSKGYICADYVKKIEPPSITLNARSASTYVGCQYALSQTGADYPEWSSSNTSVAVVDANGVVTAKGAGTAVITVSQDGGSAGCAFTVKKGSAVDISAKTLTLAQGKTAKLTSATGGVRWFSSNSAVATVSGGTVTAKSMGYATISAYTSGGASTCLVKVTAGDGTIKLSDSSAYMYVGNTYAIGMTGAASASWTSSDTSVATVDQNGVVTAKSSGTVTIRAKNDASSASCEISVYSGYYPGISLSSVELSCGKSILLGSDSYVYWSSSNTAVADVDENGVVTAKSQGYASISAYTYGGASTCLVHVTAPASVRFVYASPNCAPKDSTVTFKAITDTSRTAVRFKVSNGSETYTVEATGKTRDGGNYIWTGSRTLGTPGKWTVKAYSKTASSDYASTDEDGEGEVFVTNSTDTVTTVLGERRASDQVIDLIALFEGFLPTLTDDYITGDPTIGHGKVIFENEQFYNNLTKSEAYAYLCQTVNYGPYSTKTNDFLTSNNIKFNQRQFDALVCFAYNVGAYAIYNDSSLKSTLLNTRTGGGTIKAGGSGYVNTSGVNLRSGAGTSNSVIDTLSYGTAFTFVDAKLYNSSWYKIKLSDGTVGYIYSDYASSSGGERDLNYIDKDLFTAQFLRYHHAAGSCYWGLLTRRVDELEIFFYGDYDCDGDENNYGMYFRCANNPYFGIG